MKRLAAILAGVLAILATAQAWDAGPLAAVLMGERPTPDWWTIGAPLIAYRANEGAGITLVDYGSEDTDAALSSASWTNTPPIAVWYSGAVSARITGDDVAQSTTAMTVIFSTKGFTRASSVTFAARWDVASKRQWWAFTEYSAPYRLAFRTTPTGTDALGNEFAISDEDTSAMNDGSWRMVAWTFSAGSFACYIDGESKAVTRVAGSSASTTIADAGANIGIGARYSGTKAASHITGIIGAASVYSTALTQTQIQAIYAASKAYYGK